MKECLNCKKEYENKRPTSKFCSVSCRVLYNRKNPHTHKLTLMEKISATQQELTETMLKIKILFEKASPETYDGAKSNKPFTGDESVHSSSIRAALSYNDLRDLISSATSSTELHAAWKQVDKNKSLASWQIKELDKLKEHQRTKIDF